MTPVVKGRSGRVKQDVANKFQEFGHKSETDNFVLLVNMSEKRETFL